MKASKRAVERAQRGLPEPAKCSAHKKDGTPCGRWPIRGATVCPKHGGAAPQVRQKARERLEAASDQLMAALLKIAMSAESEAVRLAAIRDALDRAGLGAAQIHKLSIAQPWDDLLGDLMSDDVLERVSVPVESHALPPGRGGGGAPMEDEDHYEGLSAEPLAEDDDDLSFKTPDTIRSEVVYDDPPTPHEATASRRAEARGQRAMRYPSIPVQDSDLDRTEYGDVASSAAASDDPAVPPAYVREAMESEGKDWRTGERLRVAWTE